jgi:flagellar motor switch protein FliN
MPDSIVARVFETFIAELAEAIAAAGRQDVKVVRNENPSGSEPENLQWYCGKPSLDSEGHFFLGAALETWEEVGGNPEGLLGRCVEKMLVGHAQASELVANVSSSSAPANDWPRITLEASHGTNAPLAMYCVVSPALEAAIDAVATPAIAIARPSFSEGINSADLLAQVHVPVTVSFGGTQIRMKELLNLSAGSVVELDQSLSDTVEIRANSCLIARGEVVAVDGHYGVRVLELVSSPARAAKEIRQ